MKWLYFGMTFYTVMQISHLGFAIWALWRWRELAAEHQFRITLLSIILALPSLPVFDLLWLLVLSLNRFPVDRRTADNLFFRFFVDRGWSWLYLGVSITLFILLWDGGFGPRKSPTARGAWLCRYFAWAKVSTTWVALACNR